MQLPGPSTEAAAAATDGSAVLRVAPADSRATAREPIDWAGDLRLPRGVSRPVLWMALAMKLAALALFMAGFGLGPSLIPFFAAGGLVVWHLLVPGAGGICPVATRFATNRREVWLTIDDGPDPIDTPRLLEMLAERRAHATFFVIGNRAAAYPELIRQIIEEGHEVAVHTQTHPVATFWCAPPETVRREIEDPLAVLRTLGCQPRRFRPPVGMKNLFLAGALARHSLACVGWTIRSCDCVSRDPVAVVARVIRQLRPGSIILVHEGPGVAAEVRVHAIARLLDDLTTRGYACVIPMKDQLR